ncbi:hypothetical protein M422DRAFT_31849 [Sphaerobolus stellatus SS14]|uniref:Uncharacterized protein n=1 Tax=Sphaerobolus stellatus (strain SS14) TaxID=990650 RepID=A0A0C9VT33_SPHS4|nr:hypothetical protein M422DRAFT_31849 [Sphaerobolus stellatus SS14]
MNARLSLVTCYRVRRGTENAQLVPHWGRWSIELRCVQDGTKNSVRLIISLEQDAKQGAYLRNALSPVLQHHRLISRLKPLNLILSGYFQLIFFPLAFYPC